MLGPDATSALAGTRFADVRHLATTGSTNEEAMALARAGAPEGVVVVADYQTAGRGRAGRTWVAPPGSSLLVSVLLRPPESLAASASALVTFAVALAGADACADAAGLRPELKWPNDLVVGDRKLAGVLAEGAWDGARLDAVVAGMGLNVTWPAMPPELDGIAVALDDAAGRDVDRRVLLVAFLRSLDQRYGGLLAPSGPQELLDDYRARCSTLGRHVRVDQQDTTVEGRAIDVSPAGHLHVVGDDGRAVDVAVGDVVHVRRA